MFYQKVRLKRSEALLVNFSGSAVRQDRISVSVLIYLSVVMACVSIALNSPTS